ncbi:MAG: M24 family metallopeptidase [Collinsella aerofaciens]
MLDYVGEHIAAGMTTNQIDQMIYDYTVEHGGTPADLNYEGYPKACAPRSMMWSATVSPVIRDVLHEGDIINVDCSTILDSYFSDSSRMFCIGEVSAERQRWSTSLAPAWRRVWPPSSRGYRCPYGRGRAKDGRGRRF